MRFIESYFFSPNFWQKCLALALLPATLLYCFVATTRRVFSRKITFEVPIISIGNLVLGGSGKTPFLIEVARDYGNACVVLRGVGRKSKGLVIVSQGGKILCDTLTSGDEAMLLAQSLPNATVIVTKNRKEGIKKAIELQCEVVFLDDGFRFPFKKLNILLRPKLEPYFKLCIPSGGYRENPSLYKSADIVAREEEAYKRNVKLINATSRMLLLTAIANPSRLDRYLPNVVGRIILKDHSFFDIISIKKQFEELEATSLLVTQKDAVKLTDCGLPLSLLSLEMQVDREIKERIKGYIQKIKGV